MRKLLLLRTDLLHMDLLRTDPLPMDLLRTDPPHMDLLRTVLPRMRPQTCPERLTLRRTRKEMPQGTIIVQPLTRMNTC